jgi:hypothetical protein
MKLFKHIRNRGLIMEEYIKLEDLNNLLSTMYNEPGYMHAGETFYSGICAVQGAVKDLPVICLGLDLAKEV